MVIYIYFLYPLIYQKKFLEKFSENRSIYNKIYIMRTRLTERDLSRIVRRVIKEQDTVDNQYCDINDDQRKRQYDYTQSFIDKLVKSENISYDCDFHKHFLRQMLIGDLCTMWEQQMSTRLPNGIDPRDVYDFLKSRYDI